MVTGLHFNNYKSVINFDLAAKYFIWARHCFGGALPLGQCTRTILEKSQSSLFREEWSFTLEMKEQHPMSAFFSSKKSKTQNCTTTAPWGHRRKWRTIDCVRWEDSQYRGNYLIQLDNGTYFPALRPTFSTYRKYQKLLEMTLENCVCHLVR